MRLGLNSNNGNAGHIICKLLHKAKRFWLVFFFTIRGLYSLAMRLHKKVNPSLPLKLLYLFIIYFFWMFCYKNRFFQTCFTTYTVKLEACTGGFNFPHLLFIHVVSKSSAMAPLGLIKQAVGTKSTVCDSVCSAHQVNTSLCHWVLDLIDTTQRICGNTSPASSRWPLVRRGATCSAQCYSHR